MLPGITPFLFMGSETADASLVSTGVAVSVTGTFTGQASGVSLGEPSTNRRIVVVLSEDISSGSTTISSATIGGVAATVHAARGHFGGSTGLHVAVFSAVVPTGTTGDIVVTYNNGSHGTAKRASVFRLVRFDALDTGTDETTVTTGAVSVTVTTAANGVIIAGYVGSTNTVGTGVTWTNATEVYDVGDTVRHSAGWDSTTSAGTQNVQATQGTIANSGNDLAVVSFEPF